MAVGIWAWMEKDTFNNLSRLTNVALDPAFIFILVGELTINNPHMHLGASRNSLCAFYYIYLLKQKIQRPR